MRRSQSPSATKLLVIFWLIGGVGLKAAEREAPEALTAERTSPTLRTYAFDNMRFFTPPSQGGETWIDVTIKGRREWLTKIDPARCGLIIVDMQMGCCRPGWSVLPGELGKTVSQRMDNVIVPNLERLVKFFRQKGLPIFYLRIDEDAIIPEIAPDPKRVKAMREFIITKYSSGAFSTSALDNALRENGVATVFIVGTDTAGCVDGTMHEAYDRSYQTVLIEDGCLSARQELHDAAVKIWAYKGFVRSTRQVIEEYPWRAWIDPKASDE